MYRHGHLLVALSMLLTACASLRAVGDDDQIAPDPAVRYGQLQNGMRYTIVANPRPAGFSMMHLRIGVGSLQEEQDERGVAHLLEHMAFNGSTSIPESEVGAFLTRIGIAIGAGANAYTTFDETGYSINLPETDEAALEQAVFFFREIASELSISQDALDRERPVVTAEARASSPSDADAAIAQLRFLYPEAAFANRLPIGDTGVIASITPDRVRKFYDLWYRPELASLIFVGDADPVAVERLIREHFDSWRPNQSAPPAPDQGRISLRGLEASHAVTPGQLPSIMMARVSPARNDPDTVESRRRSLLREIANSILNERLQRLAMGPNPPFTAVDASFQSRYRMVDVASLQAIAVNNAWERALKGAEQEIRRISLHGFTTEEVERSIRVWVRSARENENSADARGTDGYMFALRYAEQQGRVLTRGSEDLRLLELFSSDITKASLLAAFQEMWGDSDRLLFLVTPAPLDDAEQRILSGYSSSLQMDVAPPTELPPLRFAYEDFGPPGTIVARTHNSELGITTVQFANNVRLNIRRTPSTVGSNVYVRVRIEGAALSQVGPAEGWGYAFSNTFFSGGTLAHDYLELERLKEGRLANLSLQPDYDAVMLTGETTPSALDFQLQVLAGFVTEPAFRPEVFESYHRTLAGYYQALRTTPAGIFELERTGLLYSGHPRVDYPTEEQIRRWDSAALRDLMTPMLREGPLEVGVVGNVDVDAVVMDVARTFGALPARLASLPDNANDHHAQFATTGGSPHVFEYDADGDQALLSIYWRTTDDDDEVEAAALAVAARILKQRMIERIREQDGASYAPSASNNPSSYFDDFGYLNVLLDARAQDIQSLSNIVDDLVRDMAGRISEDEFEAARGPLLRSYERDGEDALGWLSTVTSYQESEVSSTPASWAAAYRALTPDQVQAVVRTYLVPERRLEIRILPRAYQH